jgi:hypothetical protein
MKLRAFLGAGVVAIAAILPAQAQTNIYTTVLNGVTEVPPTGSAGIGVATVMIDLGTHMMHVQATFAGLSSGVTASHIHCCTAAPDSGNAGVATMVPTFAGFPSGVTSGTYDASFDLLAPATYNPAFLSAHTDAAGSFAFLVAGMNAGESYFNIHTTNSPNGEIRGYLQLLQVSAIPEPATAALVLSGLAFVGWVGARRARR